MKVIEVAQKIYLYRDYFEVIILFLRWCILLRGCEDEWNSIIIFLLRRL